MCGRPIYDLKIPRDWIEEDICKGIGGRWRITRDIAVLLHTSEYDGMFGDKWLIDNGIMYIDAGYRWNGSNVVNDTIHDLLPSAFHDAVCGWIANHGNFLDRFRLRWIADRDYGRFCMWQGFSRFRAGARSAGLHLRYIIKPW